MALVVSMNEGRKLMIRWMLKSNGADFENFHVRLFSNNFNPTVINLEQDFVQAIFPGYEPFAIQRGDFDNPFIFVNIAFINSMLIPTWEAGPGAGEMIFGWYMVEDGDNTALFAQKFDLPWLMQNGATLQLNPFSIAMRNWF